MSAFGPIVECYEEGIQLKKEKKYLEAARAFNQCIWYFNYGELPVYSKAIDKIVNKAYSQYDKCRSKLPKELQEILDSEEDPPQCGG